MQEKTRTLRSNGLSLNEIAHRLKMSKSTVRYWCRDIILSRQQQSHLLKKQETGRIHAAETIRQKRIAITKELLQQGIRQIEQLSPRELLLVGASLYWAEGYRKGDGEFGFTNSDPRMIKLIIHWLQNACNIEKSQIHARICINIAHKKRIRGIQKFWAKTIPLSIQQFSKPTFIRIANKKQYANSNEYYGTLRIKVRRSTNLRRKILGWIEGIARND